MAWSTKWSIDEAAPISKEAWDNLKIIPKPEWLNDVCDIKHLKKEGSNLIDADKNLYFQCEGCQTLFDPATKSFATLHDFAHKQGWKVKWNINGLGYKIYCAKCKGSIA